MPKNAAGLPRVWHGWLVAPVLAQLTPIETFAGNAITLTRLARQVEIEVGYRTGKAGVDE